MEFMCSKSLTGPIGNVLKQCGVAWPWVDIRGLGCDLHWSLFNLNAFLNCYMKYYNMTMDEYLIIISV